MRWLMASMNCTLCKHHFINRNVRSARVWIITHQHLPILIAFCLVRPFESHESKQISKRSKWFEIFFDVANSSAHLFTCDLARNSERPALNRRGSLKGKPSQCQTKHAKVNSTKRTVDFINKTHCVKCIKELYFFSLFFCNFILINAICGSKK